MNKIEQMFFDEWNKYSIEGEEIDNYIQDPRCEFGLECGVVIGPYKVDFLNGSCIVEIDGHEYHKTKEQRDNDYKRERYLQLKGYTVIRFTGTEVFLEPRKCVIEMLKISNIIEEKERKSFLYNFNNNERIKNNA